MKKASSDRILLLDVNVLVALAWPHHQFHGTATRRLARRRQKWATCAVTQLGFIRVSSNRNVVGVTVRPRDAALLLAKMVADPMHCYFGRLPHPLAAESVASYSRLVGHQQVSDAYLLSVARANQAVLLTFDTRLAAITASDDPIEILSEDK